MALSLTVVSSKGYDSLKFYLDNFLKLAKEHKIVFRGPKIIKKDLKIATRKNISGPGSKTWDRWISSFYKAQIKFYNKKDFLKKVSNLNKDPNLKLSIKF